MPTALQKVLDTPELFELVLLHCDLRTLLISAQRVNRKWHDIISSSPTIQEALFFRPSSRKEVTEPVFNPILLEEFPLFFDGKVHDRSHFDWLPFARDGKTDGRYAAMMRKGASWRRMLVRQPPVRTMATWRWETSWGHLIENGTFSKLALSEWCCPSIYYRASWSKACTKIRDSGAPDSRDLNMTMGMLYDEGYGTGYSIAEAFKFFWDPKTHESFAFRKAPDDQMVCIDDEDTGETDWDHPKPLSELTRDVDLLEGIGFGGGCCMSEGPSKYQLAFRKRFQYVES